MQDITIGFLRNCEPVAIKVAKNAVDEPLGCFRPQSLRGETVKRTLASLTLAVTNQYSSYLISIPGLVSVQALVHYYQRHPKNIDLFYIVCNSQCISKFSSRYPKFPSEVWGLPLRSQRSGGHRDVTWWGPGGMRLERGQSWERTIPSWYIPSTFMKPFSYLLLCESLCRWMDPKDCGLATNLSYINQIPASRQPTRFEAEDEWFKGWIGRCWHARKEMVVTALHLFLIRRQLPSNFGGLSFPWLQAVSFFLKGKQQSNVVLNICSLQPGPSRGCLERAFGHGHDVCRWGAPTWRWVMGGLKNYILRMYIYIWEIICIADRICNSAGKEA